MIGCPTKAHDAEPVLTVAKQELDITPLRAIDRMAEVTHALVRFIEHAALKPGDRLPTERELTQALAVGRSTVREVLRQFQARGVVEPRKGSGTYLLRAVAADAIHLPLTIAPGGLRDRLLLTLEVRRGLEVEAGAVAARRATRADLATIEAKLDAMEAVHIEKGAAGREDLAFHLAIYDATHNPMFGQLLGQIREALRELLRHAVRPAGFRPADPSPSIASSSTRSETATRRVPATGPRAILAIVEEDIEAMSR